MNGKTNHKKGRPPPGGATAKSFENPVLSADNTAKSFEKCVVSGDNSGKRKEKCVASGDNSKN